MAGIVPQRGWTLRKQSLTRQPPFSPTPQSGPMQTSNPEHVYIENEWYDGPVAGVADIGGQPHRFMLMPTESSAMGDVIYRVWPIDAAELVLEQEQWALFVQWHERYEAGLADTSSHPGHGGVDARWDELQTALADKRQHIPPHARQATATLERLDDTPRYSLSGPDYLLCWTLISPCN